MREFYFYHPIEVRYGDLDPQGHVNNARFLTYFEQARVEYIRRLGLWDQESFLDFGIIIAEANLTFLAPVTYGMKLRVGARVSQLGNKSMKMDYLLEDLESGKALCTGSSVLVAYNYRSRESIRVPDKWREAIRTFERMENSVQ